MTAVALAVESLTGHVELRRQEQALRRAHFAPRPRIEIAEWADQHRRLSGEASAMPGRWRTMPFQREPMDVARDRRYRRVVLMLPSQVGGKTETLLNIVGYHIDLEPCPILFVEPDLTMARALSKDRIATMFRDTPRLATKFRASGGRRDSDDTLLHKAGLGWRITLVGANSPAGLSMRPIRIALFDEPDRYPPSAGKEGDVVSIGEVRTTSFEPNQIVYLAGSPTIKGYSRIEEEFEQSDQRRWHVPCPHCGHEQPLEWGGPDEPFGLKWEDDRPETAAYLCGGCAALIDERAKEGMNLAGRYVAAHPERDIAGFHFTALVSPRVRWSRLVTEWLAAQGNQQRIKAFVNTRLARTYEEPGEQLDVDALARRRETYAAEVPAAVGLLTMAVDVQTDRLEAAVWGWAAGEEEYPIFHQRIYGDPLKPDVWRELEMLRTKHWQHESGATIRIRLTAIDTGHHIAAVSDYVRPRQRGGVIAIKGSSQLGRPIIGSKPGKSDKYRIRIWSVGTDAAKDVLFGRLKRVDVVGPGYVHFPGPDRIDEEFLRQFGAEKAVTVFRGGRRFRTYRQLEHRANEAIDLAVYNRAALWVLGPAVREHLGALAEQVARQRAPARPVAAGIAPTPVAPVVPTPARGRRTISRGVDV